MATLDAMISLNIAPETVQACFDKEPFGFTHSLSNSELFKYDSLQRLTEKYSGYSNERCQFYYIAAGAETPGTAFTSVPMPHCTPNEALERLSSGSYRIVLKRPEEIDEDHRDLLQHLFKQIVDRLGGLGGDRVVRLEGGLLISSSATTTPFHFDQEVSFFCQIEGDKIYHVYSPDVVSEPELEQFYRRGRKSIAEVELSGRDPRREHVFTLAPGLGMHQPQNAPHWVQTTGSKSISYAVVFETESMRARARARAANYYLRQLSLNPARPGAHPASDAIKSRAMRVVLPMRTGVADLVRSMRKASA